jgi:hypothetical protein
MPDWGWPARIERVRKRMKDECLSLSSTPAATVDLRLWDDGTPAGAILHSSKGIAR